jgi:MFS family permease
MTPPKPVRRPFVLACVMAAMFMIAIETTIVSTAMPQIAGQLGDLHLYAWVFAAFLLTQTATTVLFGKLVDLFGRKPILLFGIAVFLAGTLLCGLSWSMPSLIAFRLIQGVGAGAIQPICLTVIGDLYTMEERAKIQGWLASVWGVSSVAGPLAGGLIIQHLSWAWVFWINIPIGAAAAFGFWRFLHERITPQVRHIDSIGASLFAIAIAALMVAVTQLGTAETSLALIAGAVFAVAAALFVVQELRARDPMLAFGLWGRRRIATANAATLLSGMTLVGLTTFLPMYVQGVMERSPLVAGFALTMMVLGWPVGATLAAKNFVRFGIRTTLLFGAALLPVGAMAFLLLTAETSPVIAGAGSIIVGLGMGFLSSSAIVMIQGSVGWAERGAATASNVFARNLGSTLGATVLGGVLNMSLATGGAATSYDKIRTLLEHPEGLAGSESVRAALAHGLHLTFWGVFLTASLVLVFALMVPPPVPQPAAE